MSVQVGNAPLRRFLFKVSSGSRKKGLGGMVAGDVNDTFYHRRGQPRKKSYNPQFSSQRLKGRK